MSGADRTYRCTLRTGFDGTVSIRTHKPVSHPVGGGSWMPAHVHFKVRALGHPELLTQLRFVGAPYGNGL